MTVYTKQQWADFDAAKTLSAARMQHIEDGLGAVDARIDTLTTSPPPAAGSIPGLVFLDSFNGATDDAKLTDAMAVIGADTYKRPICVSNKNYKFSLNRQLFPGFHLTGLGAIGDQVTSQNEVTNKLEFDGTGVWWNAPTQGGNAHRGVKFTGLFFEGNSAATFSQANPTPAGKWLMRDLGFNLWRNVLGTPSLKWLNIACVFDGYWNVNNGYDTAFTVGGSDSTFWQNGMLIDSPPTIFNAPANYHIRFDFQEKTPVGPIYMTTERSSGILILGNETTAGMVLSGGGRCEGRNATTPCLGANIRISGGHLTIRDWWVSYGMSNPNSATTGHTGEIGVITQTGGDVLYDGLYYDKTAAVPETVPFIGVSGGKARVRNIRTGTKGGAWSGLPRVLNSGATVDADNSVTVI